MLTCRRLSHEALRHLTRKIKKRIYRNHESIKNYTQYSRPVLKHAEQASDVQSCELRPLRVSSAAFLQRIPDRFQHSPHLP
jgi:hypothetical protein